MANGFVESFQRFRIRHRTKNNSVQARISFRHGDNTFGTKVDFPTNCPIFGLKTNGGFETNDAVLFCRFQFRENVLTLTIGFAGKLCNECPLSVIKNQSGDNVCPLNVRGIVMQGNQVNRD